MTMRIRGVRHHSFDLRGIETDSFVMENCEFVSVEGLTIVRPPESRMRRWWGRSWLRYRWKYGW